MRTDFTSEIDGALASRNLGSRHFSEIARSGNGNMLSDLSEDQVESYEELDGLGEGFEELSGNKLAIFRAPLPGERPPFPAKPGRLWMRKRIPTGARKPGGGHIARVKWVQMSPQRLGASAKRGEVSGLGAFDANTMTLGAIGLGVGVLAYMLLRQRAA